MLKATESELSSCCLAYRQEKTLSAASPNPLQQMKICLSPEPRKKGGMKKETHRVAKKMELKNVIQVTCVKNAERPVGKKNV